MDLKDVVESIKKVEDRVIELIAKQSEHNVILQEHKQYSVALQAEQQSIKERLVPIQRHVTLMEAILKIVGLTSVAVLAQFLIRRFL